MTLEKLKIYYEEQSEYVFSGPIEALFNPNELKYTKKVTWETERTITPHTEAEYLKLRLASTELETLAVSLFFDTYALGVEGGFSAASLLGPLAEPLGLADTKRSSAVSVLNYTNKVAQLSRFDIDLHRPPICELHWGKIFVFRGVLQSLAQTITLFLEDGTPVRATLDCEFIQYQTIDERIGRELHSADVTKRYTVLPGDTLSSIAAALYDDPALWRPIAEANGIDNPRGLSPGRVLIIPKLR